MNISPPLIPGIISIGYHFSICIHVYTVFVLYSLFHILSPSLVTTTPQHQAGPVLPFCSLIFVKEEKK
jgi:hypothetical protein